MRVWRSLLFVVGNQRRMLDKVTELPADGFLFDLEDTITPEEKPLARDMIKEYIPKVVGERSWIRVNSVPSGFLEADLEYFVGTKGLAGFVVPKMDSEQDVLTVDRMMNQIETKRGLTPGSTPIIVMIESANGVLDSRPVMMAAKRIESMVYGGGEDGDMNVSLGATWTSEGPEMMFVRQFSLVSARAAGFECPLDGVFANVRDPEGFRKDTELSRRLGYRGRTAIHPNKIEDCNKIYTPTPVQVDYYTRVVDAFNEALKRGVASITVDGKLVDFAMAKTAQRLLDHMQAIKELDKLHH